MRAVYAGPLLVGVLLPLLGSLVGGCDPGAPPDDAGVVISCTTDDECDDGLFCSGVERCAGGRCAPTPPPCEEGQVCDEPSTRCQTICAMSEDADGDGQRATECGGSDCDDSDPDRFPGNTEVCDVAMHDEDCDPSTYGFRDADGDGSPDARCCNVDPVNGEPSCGLDCDDAAPGVSPRVPEVCNGFDDDCDGGVDEGLVLRVTIDVDGDGHGDRTEGAPSMDVCMTTAGWAELADDCDDGNAMRYPGNPELCDDDMVDEDCSGAGNDVPGGCDCTLTETEVCGTMGRCAGATRTCMGGRWGPCAVVPSTEVCDGTVDEDCDGSVDEELTVVCYRDNDGDGYAGDGASATPTCRSAAPDRTAAPWNGCPPGFTGRSPASGTDCCDSDARAHPGATAFQGTPSACGGYDFDCNSNITFERPARLQGCTGVSPCTGSADRDGWCTTVPTTCGEDARWGSGCWSPGSGACYPTTCWPTPNRCR